MVKIANQDKAFPDRLARLMDERDMTKADLAREVWGTFEGERGYTVARNRQSLSKYLSGKAYPTGPTKRKLAEALGVSYSTLFPLEKPEDRNDRQGQVQADACSHDPRSSCVSDNRTREATHMRTFPTLSKKPNAHGYFEIRWSEFDGRKWRSKRRSTKTGDRTKAEAALARMLTLRDADADDIPTLAYTAEVYWRQHSRAKRTEKSDQQNLRAVLGAFGDWPITLIKQADVDGYTRKRLKSVKPGTARREITALQAVMNWASKKGMIPGRPMFRFDKPSEQYQPRDVWLLEHQEQEVLAAIADAPLSVRLFVHMGLTYGVRKGAMMDLTWQQVNFITNSIDFNKPNRAPVRKRRPVVAMTRTIRGEMEEGCQGKAPNDFVLDRGTPYHFRKWMERIGYEWVTPHVLKHSAITLMLRQGMRPEGTYRHHTLDELQTLAERRGI